MGKTLILAAAVLAAGLLPAGCNTSGCTDLRSSIPLAGFYSAESLAAIALPDLVVGGIGAPADSLLIDPSASSSAQKEVYLPFRFDTSEVAFKFGLLLRSTDSEGNETGTEVVDTITFGYTAFPYFASEECGAMYSYRIKSCTHTSFVIDSVAITDSLVTNTDVERIKIYFRTSTSL